MWLPALVVAGLSSCLAVELTFELPDKSRQCFYEEVQAGTDLSIAFQVVIGGNHDVDVLIKGPKNIIVSKQQRRQFGTIPFKALQTGTYSACFSNEFSTYTAKLVYMSFEVHDGKGMPTKNDTEGAMTLLEERVNQIHTNLNDISAHQTHYRLREMSGRDVAEKLNTAVMWHSACEAFSIACFFLTYVVIIRNFFSDKKSIR